MSEDIVDELRHGTGYEGETRWNAADEIESLRASLKEAESTRAKIIEECAKVADAYAKEHWGHTEEEHAAETISGLLRALKSSSNTPKPQKNDCQGEDTITILRSALRRANAYIDTVPLTPVNTYKEIKAVIRSALECSDSEGTGNG
jgi:predicted RNase H-like nuclease (RuvC/YqgF family)